MKSRGQIMLLTLFLLAGCIEESHSPVISSDRRVSLHIPTSYPVVESDTKVTFDQESKPQLTWTGDESARVIFGIEGKNNSSNPTISSTGDGVFSGEVAIPSGFSIDNLKGIIIPAENDADFRGNHSSDKQRLRMSVDSLQTQQSAGVFNPIHCPFFAPLTASELISKGNGQYAVPTKTLKSAVDLIRFNVYGKHPAQRDSEVLKSIRIEIKETDKVISGTAEWNTKTQPTTLNSNGKPWAQVSLQEECTIADKTKADGIKVFLGLILGGSRTVNKVIVTTDKAVYTKSLSKSIAQKNVNKFTVHQVGINLANGYTREAVTIYPEDKKGWTEADPEDLGFDSDKIAAITDYLSGTKITAMNVIVGGEQIYSYGDLTYISYLASCRKSILSMMFGKYVEDGTINLNLTVRDLIEKYGMKEDIGGLLDSEKEATILDLITARSGVYHPASNAGDATNKPARGTYKHGVHYLYNNWDFNFAGAVFERLVKGTYSGKEIYRILQDDIAIPIGMADYSLSKQKYGGTWTGSNPPSYYPAYHFYLSTRDMARIGYLMLRKGVWKGKQIISESWIETTTTPFSTFAEVNPDGSGYYSYGYMWWIFDKSYYKTRPHLEGAYTASGSGGQFITILPKLDMVVAWKTNTANSNSTTSTQLRSVLTKLANAYKGEL